MNGSVGIPTIVGPRSASAAARAIALAQAAANAPRRFAAKLANWRRLRLGSSTSTASSSNRAIASRAGLKAAPALQPAGTGRKDRPGGAAARRPGIVWFRADLRLHDNEALTRANAECSSILPVYCFDPRDYGRSPQGYDRTGPYRATFLLQAVTDLRNRLRAAGSDLIVRIGRPEEVLPEFARRIGASAVYCHSEVTYEESQVESRVNEAITAVGAKLQAFWTNTLHHPDDLPFSLAEMPQNFDKFKSAVAAVTARAALPTPEQLRGTPLGARAAIDAGDIPKLEDLGLSPLPSTSSSSAPTTSTTTAAAAATTSKKEESINVMGASIGGESEALNQLKKFIAGAQSNQALQSSSATATSTTKPACGAAHSTSFSSNVAPWLATGCLSPRMMVEEAQRALRGCASATSASASNNKDESASTGSSGGVFQWVQFELLWRDFFRLLTRRHSEVVLPRAREAVAAGAGVGSASYAMA